MANTNKNKKSKTTKKQKVDKKKKNMCIFKKILLLLTLIAVFLLVIKELPKEEKERAFEYGGEAWMIVNYDGVDSYYPELYFEDKLNHELYLTTDPRLNGVNSSGEFDVFSNSGYLSLSPEVEACKWEIPRTLSELEKFLQYTTKLKLINRTTNEAGYALEMNMTDKYRSCYNSIYTSVISIEIGNSSVVQARDNPYCYIIKIKDCRDVEVIEKFITRVIVENNQEKE